VTFKIRAGHVTRRHELLPNRTVTAIVIEVLTRLIGDPGATVRAWATVSLCGHAPEAQVSRWGLPLLTDIFITDEAVKDECNRSHPTADVPSFSQIVADALPPFSQLAGSSDDPAAYAQRVVGRLFPTTCLMSSISGPATPTTSQPSRPPHRDPRELPT
jgi:hypothetical protein